MGNDFPIINDCGSIALKQITSGNTVEEWAESAKYDPDLYEKVKRNLKFYMKYDLAFESMNSIPTFLHIFHCSEFSMQMHILKMLVSGSCCHNTFTFLRLFQVTGSTHSTKVIWSSKQSEKNAEKLFRYLKTGFGDANGFYFPNDEAWIVNLLAVIYGDDQVDEVIKEWTEKKLQNSFCDFAPLVEQWDAVKRYPIDWAVSVADTHTCLKVSTDVSAVNDNYNRIYYTYKKYDKEIFEHSSFEKIDLY